MKQRPFTDSLFRRRKIWRLGTRRSGKLACGWDHGSEPEVFCITYSSSTENVHIMVNVK